MSAKLGSNEGMDDEDFLFLGEFVNERGTEIFVSAKWGVNQLLEGSVL